jgi:hypothetical protein
MAEAKLAMKSDPKPASRPTYAAEAIQSDVNTGVFLGNPALDNVVGCVIAMSAEMWSMRRRMKVMESILAQSGVTADRIESYVPTDAEKLAWEQDRDRFISMTLGPLGNQGYRGFSADFPQR